MIYSIVIITFGLAKSGHTFLQLHAREDAAGACCDNSMLRMVPSFTRRL